MICNVLQRNISYWQSRGKRLWYPNKVTDHCSHGNSGGQWVTSQHKLLRKGPNNITEAQSSLGFKCSPNCLFLVLLTGKVSSSCLNFFKTFCTTLVRIGQIFKLYKWWRRIQTNQRMGAWLWHSQDFFVFAGSIKPKSQKLFILWLYKFINLFFHSVHSQCWPLISSVTDAY